MKLLGCAVVVLVVAVGGFFALTYFVLSDSSEDQSALTEEVELTVIDPEESRDSTTGTGYRFDYAYEVGGEWYGGERRIQDNFWTPGQPLTACVDPDSPADHVITIRRERCGQETIVGGSVQQAEPTSAPDPQPAG